MPKKVSLDIISAGNSAPTTSGHNTASTSENSSTACSGRATSMVPAYDERTNTLPLLFSGQKLAGSTANTSTNSSIASMDLADCQKTFPGKIELAAHVITSLRNNYDTYTTLCHLPKGFCAISTLALPPIKPDSQYKFLEPFIRAAKVFFDGDTGHRFSQGAIIGELYALERKIDEQYEQRTCDILQSGVMIDEELLREELLLEILLTFEAETGFSKPVKITPEDGLITKERFETLVSAGQPFYDLGATAQHGPHSHRVQLYLLDEHLKKHPDLLPDLTQLQRLVNDLEIAIQKGKTLQSQISSIFYRLMGIGPFNAAFDWAEFKERRETRDNKLNEGKKVPRDMDAAHIFVQLYDRRGYAGFFSVPSTFGILQQLGLFGSLPTLGKPNADQRQVLKRLFSLTRSASEALVLPQKAC